MVKEVRGREVWFIKYYDSPGCTMCNSFESAYKILRNIIETDVCLSSHAINEYLGILDREYERGLKRNVDFLYEFAVGKIAQVRELPVYDWVEEG